MVIIDGIVFSLQQNGGISVYFHHLLNSLVRANVETTCILEEPLMQKVDTVGGSLRLERWPARRLERYRKCRVRSGSVFHSSYYRLPRSRGMPVLVTVYDFVYERLERGPRLWVHRTQKRRAIRSAQAVICISESTRDDLLEFVGETPGQQIHVIHCGAADTFRPLKLAPAPIPYVLFVGQRGGYKNFRLLLEAIQYLPDVKLYCVGGGPIASRELAGLPPSVAERVRHLGHVSDEELNALYCRAQCLVYPSSYEGFGIPVIEAMRAGCPVVSMACKAVVEVGGAALTIVPDPDPRAMAEAITRTASSDREALVKTGLEVAARYSWETAHRKTMQVYRSLGGS